MVRLQNYLEDNDLTPHTKFALRTKLSIPDILILIKEEVRSNTQKYREHVVMTLDLKGPSKIQDADHRDGGPQVRLPNVGPPQGSVMSPLLYNIAMVSLAEILNTIEGIWRAMRADDVMVWMTKGWLVLKEERFQAVADYVGGYARAMGLFCSPEKFEILTVPRPIQDDKVDLTVTMAVAATGST
ncbi:hypothetical protein HPB49_014685 [Dermacentor silvarum]|uniref:Uncharacterized protein n=1 Tax=Dermacentor silvarum TaxID=543639 RepID=A0ACB8DJV7_DERSI|nr:hypothetical protein HPB49_014685 [Dermacentor silvarum]